MPILHNPITLTLPHNPTLPRAKLFLRSSLIVAFGLAFWCPTFAHAAEPVADTSAAEAKMQQSCQHMMQQRTMMQQETKAEDAATTNECAQMNAAPEEKKIGLLAIIVTHMNEHQCAMHARSEKIEDQTAQHMMCHMQMGKESMSSCPMMQGMDCKMPGMEKSATDPKATPGSHDKMPATDKK